MTKIFLAITLSLILAFSLSLLTGCQKANEKARDVKEEAAETKVDIKQEAAETVKDVTAEEVKEKAVKTAEEIKREAAKTVRRITIIGEPASKNKIESAESVRRITIIGEPAGKNKKEAAESVKDATVEGVKEKVVETEEEIEKKAEVTVRKVTIKGVTVTEVSIKGVAEEIEEETEEEPVEIEQPFEFKRIPPPTLIAQPDYYDTVSVTLKWNAVANPYGNSVKYFVRLYNATIGFIYSPAWMSGKSWTSIIPGLCNYSWQVKARDNVYLQESGWSTADLFVISDYCSAW